MLYELKHLTQEEINLIATALANRSWGEVNGLMAKITAQVQQQDQARAFNLSGGIAPAESGGGGSGGPGPFRP